MKFHGKCDNPYTPGTSLSSTLLFVLKSKWVWSGNATVTDNTHTNLWHHEEGHYNAEKDTLKQQYNFSSTTTKKQVSMIRKYHNYILQINPRHLEEEPQNNHKTPLRQTKQNNQLFAKPWLQKLERTQSYAKQSIEQTQNPKMGATINNNRTTALERTAALATGVGLKCILLVPNLS